MCNFRLEKRERSSERLFDSKEEEGEKEKEAVSETSGSFEEIEAAVTEEVGVISVASSHDGSGNNSSVSRTVSTLRFAILDILDHSIFSRKTNLSKGIMPFSEFPKNGKLRFAKRSLLHAHSLLPTL